jgi:hypothetical protein
MNPYKFIITKIGDAINAQKKGKPYTFKRTCSIVKSDEEIEKTIDEYLHHFPEEKYEAKCITDHQHPVPGFCVCS